MEDYWTFATEDEAPPPRSGEYWVSILFLPVAKNQYFSEFAAASGPVILTL